MKNLFAIMLVIIGLIVLALPDPSSVTDFVALAIIVAGLNRAGAKIDVKRLLK